MQFGCRYLPALAPLGRRTLARQELNGCEYLARCLCADSLDVEDFIETSLAQCVEVVVEPTQYLVANIHCAELLCTAANEDGK